MKTVLVSSLTLILLAGCSLKSDPPQRWSTSGKRSAATRMAPEEIRTPPGPLNAAATRSAERSLKRRDAPLFKPKLWSSTRESAGGNGTPWPSRVNSKDGSMMVYVQSGRYLVGRVESPEASSRTAQAAGAQFASLPGFYIDRLEITVRQYKKFNSTYDEKPFTDGKPCPDCPAMGIDWMQAAGYCRWAEKRLPTETEWIAAARGAEANVWPWGPEFSPERANLIGSADGAAGAAPVGSYPKGTSPSGALDMIGNVWEWVETPYRLAPKSAEDPGRTLRMVKGGGWASRKNAAGVSFRNVVHPGMKNPTFGFRCAKPYGSGATAQEPIHRTLTRK